MLERTGREIKLWAMHKRFLRMHKNECTFEHTTLVWNVVMLSLRWVCCLCLCLFPKWLPPDVLPGQGLHHRLRLLPPLVLHQAPGLHHPVLHRYLNKKDTNMWGGFIRVSIAQYTVLALWHSISFHFMDDIDVTVRVRNWVLPPTPPPTPGDSTPQP